MLAHFWMLAALMALLTTATLVVPLYWRAPAGSATASPRRWQPWALAAALPVLALAIYFTLGRPDLAVADITPRTDIAAMHTAAASGGNRDGGDLTAATARLQARLAANPDDASGWRLLAQSLEFQGRTEEAQAARARADQLSPDAGDTPSLLAVSGVASPAKAPAQATAPMTAEVTALIQSAQQHRRQREFDAAIRDFATLEQRGALDADLWADYADALGSARRTLEGKAAACIDAALRLDPQHIKALWLRASLLNERRDHRAALATWEQLARLLPADSPDGRIIAANLAEARANLAASAPAAASPPVRTAKATATAPGAARLQGSVRLDPRWQTRVAPGSVLYVFARAADERGPPLAVWRTSTGSWPVRFTLDDGNAMVEGRRLSDFKRVVLEARVSRSGNALPQPGDLRAVSAVLDPHGAPEQLLTIAEEIGAGG